MENDQCPICLQEIEKDNKITTLCNHDFCNNCFNINLKYSNNCAICKRQITEDSDSEFEFESLFEFELDSDSDSESESKSENVINNEHYIPPDDNKSFEEKTEN
jgi:hypothetical protein